MPVLAEAARAKVNLTLRIFGRRADGYHELESRVAFAGVGDRLFLTPGAGFSLRVEGPFARSIGSDNLVEQAAQAVIAFGPQFIIGDFLLEKNLPVAAGLGGGSADAAAALRLLQRANRARAHELDLPAIAARLGADVTVCLEQSAALISGIGEIVKPHPPFPDIPAVLVNPGVGLETAEVFRELRAEAFLPARRPRAFEAEPAATLGEFFTQLRADANDLEPPAMRLAPSIQEVKDALIATGDCRLARLSGSGPTCFGLYSSRSDADAAGRGLKRGNPGWWVAVTSLN